MASVTPNSQPINNRPAVIRQINPGDDGAAVFLRMLPAWIISGVLHIVFIGMFLLVTVGVGAADDTLQEEIIETQVEDAPAKEDLTNTDLGIDSEVPTNYDVQRIEEVSVPGPVLPNEVVGLSNAPEGPAQTIPPPPGFGGGTGRGDIQSLTPGNANPFGLPGGMGGLLMQGGGFGARLASGATRQRMVEEGGGNARSEQAVALGLEWLAKHQAPDGHWSMEGFTSNARDKYGPGSKGFTCNCTGVGQKNDIAGTAFGVLPFLAAGITHKPIAADKKSVVDYTKSVEGALKFLMLKQDKSNGSLGGMYEHGLATIALCEAYGLTADPGLKAAAQRGLNYIVFAQHEAGGWRYGPKQAGDTSVTGWQIMALKSGQMAGLSVPKPTIDGATKYLNSCMSSTDYGYGYTGVGSTPTMSAVGLLCRQYLGWSPRKPELRNGVDKHIGTSPPAVNSMYYSYYATQVMHHMGGDHWAKWNPVMRDALIKAQDVGNDARHMHQKGSWDPKTDGHGASWGRVGQTSLSLLTLEVYYRHLPLYRRDMGTVKVEDEK
jgi:hypothetical protein